MNHASLGISVLLFGVGLLRCSSTFESFEERLCPSDGSVLTYETFGEDFMTGWCQSCHGSSSGDRRGAPGEYIFDTVEQIRRHKERIYVRSAGSNTSMPPGPDDPSLDEREKLAEWLACGAL